MKPSQVTQRLLRAADVTAKIDPKAFNMAYFGKEKSCGFVGCSVGWMAQKKLFGLYLDKDGLFSTDYDVHINDHDSPEGVDETGFEAVAAAFGITLAATYYLFSGMWDSYDPKKRKPTPKLVAQRIRKFSRDRMIPEDAIRSACM